MLYEILLLIMMMVICNYCDTNLNSVCEFNKHIYRHRNVHNFEVICPRCKLSYKKYASYIAHYRRNHPAVITETQRPLRSEGVQCLQQSELKCCNCGSGFLLPKDITKHLLKHISYGETITCFEKDCTKTYNNASSFKSHYSRCHKSTQQVTLVETTVTTNQSLESDNISELNSSNDENYECSDVMMIESMEQQSVCNRPICGDMLSEDVNSSLHLFLLKLTAKHLIPESTVQILCQELVDVTSDYSDRLSLKLKEILEEKEEQCNKKVVLDTVKSFQKEFEQNKLLRSSYLRRKNFVADVNYVAPQIQFLDSEKLHHFYYIPLQKTLSLFVQNASIQSAIHEYIVNKKRVFSEKVYQDYEDGKIFETMYSQHCDSDNMTTDINIILYQDAFELCNPIGSSKKKYKLIAIYAILADIPPQFRAKIESIFLICLAKEKYVKIYGYPEIFKPLVSEVVKIQSEGLLVGQNLHRVNVIAMAGDNLGSNGIGGFVESFSCHNYCRFCLASKHEIMENPLFVGTYRNPSNYEEHARQKQQAGTSIPHYFGVKENSVLNSIKNFHVTSGLPPCLAHDIFEGVASWDTAMVLRRFIREYKWFTLDHLNGLIAGFHYNSHDIRNKPANIPDHMNSLGGHALQNKCLLKLLPMIIHSKIQDVNDPNWEMVLKMKQIIEIIMAPKISESQVAYLRLLVTEYIEQRAMLFPTHNLKPKHHFLLHYEYLIRQFGPLTLFWTMRFEQKHQFFKNCISATKNFKNVSQSLSEKHQLLQSYYANGLYFNNSPEIVTANEEFAVKNSLGLFKSAKKVTMFGTTYLKNHFVILEPKAIFGKIKTILYNEKGVLFEIISCKTEFVYEMGAYEVVEEDENDINLVFSHKLLDYSCLSAVEINNRHFISLDHAFLDMPFN